MWATGTIGTVPNHEIECRRTNTFLYWPLVDTNHRSLCTASVDYSFQGFVANSIIAFHPLLVLQCEERCLWHALWQQIILANSSRGEDKFLSTGTRLVLAIVDLERWNRRLTSNIHIQPKDSSFGVSHTAACIVVTLGSATRIQKSLNHQFRLIVLLRAKIRHK